MTEKAKDFQDVLKHVDHETKNCTCTKIENEILQMARDAYKNLRCQGNTNKSFQQFEKELHETNYKIFDTIKVLGSIKSICKHERDILSISTGSVIFTIRCPTLFSLDELWELCISRGLERQMNEDFLTQDLRDRYRNMNLYLKVNMEQEDYTQAKQYLGRLNE